MPETRNIDRFLKLLVEKDGSDLHIKSGSTPKIRISGMLTDLSREILSPQAVDEILSKIMSDRDRDVLKGDMEVDFIYEVRSLGRFRFTVYRQMTGLAIAVRYVRFEIPTFDELNLPPVLNTLVNKSRGLILVTGASGSGKSTTLAAMIETLNRTSQLNIVTIEDPIEYAFKEKRCMIQQREIGRDTPSWKEAMRRLLRQNPDVIMLSEIRDPEVMMMALSAANTGHLVLSTLSAMDAGQTINRMISLAPGELVGEIRYLIASALAGIVSQRLLPRQNSGGRVPAVEVLIATEKVTKLILNPEQLLHVRQVIHESHGTHGMQTFDQSLGDLQQAGLISLEEALKHASSPTDFRFRMKGVKSGMNWTEFGEDGQN